MGGWQSEVRDTQGEGPHRALHQQQKQHEGQAGFPSMFSSDWDSLRGSVFLKTKATKPKESFAGSCNCICVTASHRYTHARGNNSPLSNQSLFLKVFLGTCNSLKNKLRVRNSQKLTSCLKTVACMALNGTITTRNTHFPSAALIYIPSSPHRFLAALRLHCNQELNK